MIADKFNNTCYFRLVTTTKLSDLDLNQRLCYSALLTEGDGLTQEGVSTLSGLDAKGTAAAALKALTGHGLVVQKGRLWVALEPTRGHEAWFVMAIKDKNWRRQFAHTKLYMRSDDCALTLRQVVVYSTLISLAKGSKDRPDLPPDCRGRVCDGLTHEYLSLITGIGVRTVKATIHKLADLKLARSFRSTLRSRFALVLLEPDDEAISWFLDKEAESYPGLFEFVSCEAQPLEEDAVQLEHEDVIGQEPGSMDMPPEAAQTSELPPEVLLGRRTLELPIQAVEIEILPPVSETGSEANEPQELHRRRDEDVRLEMEQVIREVLLGLGYSEKAVATLSRSFDKRFLPSFDAYKKMIHDAEATFRRNRSEGKYASVRTSELLLVEWLDHHRREAVEGLDRFLEAHDRRAYEQRVRLVGRAALDRPWEDYADPMTAPFDARFLTERVDGGEKFWDSWGRDYGQEACRKSLMALPRVRIDEMVVEAGRIEPEDFEARLREIVPPKPVFKKPTEEEMFEALRAELDAA